MLLVLSLLIPILMAAACAQPARPAPSPSARPDEVIGIREIIKSRTQAGAELTILVQGEKAADTRYDKASVKVTAQTVIENAGNSRTAKMSELTDGTVIEVVFDGAVAESYPVQGTATSVRILSPSA